MAFCAAERSPDLVRPNMDIDSDVDHHHIITESERQSVPINIQDISAVSVPSRRIVLLGKTGAGKSATGNTILGRKMFGSKLNVDSVTHKCSDFHVTVSGRSVSVVDTPGFFDTQIKPEELMTEIARSVYLSGPGPHAFIIVFPVNMRFTEQEQQILQMIKMMFSEEVLKYSIILFTHGDLLAGNSVKELVEGNSKLKHLVDQCGGRYLIFNNKDENNTEQVNDLLQKIDSMIEQNGGGHYSNQMYEDAQRHRQFTEELIKRNNVSSCLADQCEATYYVKRNREQMTDLLQKIDTMIEQNDGYYKKQMFGDAKRFRQEKREMKQQEKEQWKQQEEKQRNKEIGRMINKIGAELEAQKWLETDRRKTKIQSDYEEAMRHFIGFCPSIRST